MNRNLQIVANVQRNFQKNFVQKLMRKGASQTKLFHAVIATNLEGSWKRGFIT